LRDVCADDVQSEVSKESSVSSDGTDCYSDGDHHERWHNASESSDQSRAVQRRNF
jgi:hypothetical protein